MNPKTIECPDQPELNGIQVDTPDSSHAAGGFLSAVCKFYLRKAFFAACLDTSLYAAYQNGAEHQAIKDEVNIRPAIPDAYSIYPMR